MSSNSNDQDDVSITFSADNMLCCTVPVPQQTNLSDCGAFLLHFVDLFLQQPTRDLRDVGGQSWFPPADAMQKRRTLAELMQSMVSESVRNSLPKLYLPDMQLTTAPITIDQQNPLATSKGSHATPRRFRRDSSSSSSSSDVTSSSSSSTSSVTSSNSPSSDTRPDAISHHDSENHLSAQPESHVATQALGFKNETQTRSPPSTDTSHDHINTSDNQAPSSATTRHDPVDNDMRPQSRPTIIRPPSQFSATHATEAVAPNSTPWIRHIIGTTTPEVRSERRYDYATPQLGCDDEEPVSWGELVPPVTHDEETCLSIEAPSSIATTPTALAAPADADSVVYLGLREFVNQRRQRWVPGKRIRSLVTFGSRQFRVVIDRLGTEYVSERPAK